MVLTDINAAMLTTGRDRLQDQGLAGNLLFCQVNAETQPFPDNHFDCVTIGFGLRNVTHKQKALAEMSRVLKPGGRALVLEFSHPSSQALSKVYDLYSFTMLPILGRLITNDADSYRYLAELAHCYWKDGRRLRPVVVVKGYQKTILDELELQREAANVSQLRKNFLGRDKLDVPEVYWNLCHPSVMVMERIHGTPVGEVERLKAQVVSIKLLAYRVLQGLDRHGLPIRWRSDELDRLHGEIHVHHAPVQAIIAVVVIIASGTLLLVFGSGPFISISAPRSCPLA